MKPAWACVVNAPALASRHKSACRVGVSGDFAATMVPQMLRVAVLIVAAVEGSVAICRAQRSAAPLDDVAAELESLVAARLPQ